MATKNHFDLYMERVDQSFDQVRHQFEQTGRSITGLAARVGRLERGQSTHTVLLSIITLAVVIPLIQSTLAV